MFHLFSILTLLFFTFLLIKWILNPPNTHKTLPPSPPKLPILGNLHQLGMYPHRTLSSLARRYGPLMLLHFGTKPVLIVSSSDLAREIMTTHDLIFANRPRTGLGDKLLYQSKTVSAAAYGEYWRKMRAICVVHLLSNSRVQSFRSVRGEEIGLLFNKIRDSISFSKRALNLSEILGCVTNDVICRVAFGRKYSEGEGGRSFKELLGEFLRLLGDFSVGEFIPALSWIDRVTGLNSQVEKIAKEFDDFLESVVEEHIIKSQKIKSNADHGSIESDQNQKDFVDILLDNQKGNLAGISIDRESIKAITLDMFAAGTHTTYAILEWTMTELLRHPKVMKQLQNEVRAVANGKPFITEDDLDQLHYLKALIKETLRVHPPVPLLVPREATKDVQIQGYDIAAGTMVITNVWAIGRDPEQWDEPEVFRPERFLDNPIDFKGQDFELIPFGAGRRSCPGTLFAMTTNELVLANLVNKFDWELPGGARGCDLDMTESTGVTIYRKVPLFAIVSLTH